MTFIHCIETLSAPFQVSQEEMYQFIASNLEDTTAHRKYKALQRDRSIMFKYSVLPDFNASCSTPLLFGPSLPTPSTQERMQVFKHEASQMASKVCAAAIETSQLRKEEFTHIIGISCTGMFAPGLEVEMLGVLGLMPTVERHAVNFMGCHAAFHGLRLADYICKTQSEAVVLLFSVELCSLHFRQDNADDNLLSTYLFGDGAAAAVLSAREPKEKGAYLSCTHFGSYLIAEGKEDMKWDIGQQGFEMVLNKNIPAHITQHMRKAYLDFLGKNKLNPSDVRQYAIHPGGKNILRAFAEAIGITASDLPESYAILSHYGNMSSTTLLFVLSQFLSNKGENPDMSLLYAAAFGPGLSVENALLTWQQIP